MRQLSPAMLDAISGSTPDAKITANAWYGGTLLESGLEIGSNWTMHWDGADQNLVQAKVSLTVADSTGRLAPWGFDEALSAAGSVLQVTFVCGTESVDIGWYPISTNAPTEQWRVAGTQLQWVSGGASIPIEADDRTLLISDARFVAPEAVPAGATVISEVRRLLTGICPVTVAAGVTDGPVSASIVYKDERLAPVFDLVKSLNCRYRMTGDGQFEIYPLTKTAPVWTVQGRGGGALVSVNRSQGRASLINGVVSTSADPSNELRALATLTTGPLQWDGVLGRKINYHNAVATTQAGVQADAQTILNNSTILQTVPLTVVCAPHPGIQIGDWVQVAQPVIDGSEYPLVGLVSTVDLKGSAGGIGEMTLTVQCALNDVQAVGLYVRRHPQ